MSDHLSEASEAVTAAEEAIVNTARLIGGFVPRRLWRDLEVAYFERRAAELRECQRIADACAPQAEPMP